MPDAHSLLSASAAHRWGSCHASLKMSAAYPERSSSKAADRGTAQHTVAAWCLENDALPDQYPQPAVDVDGVQWPITQEMRNAIHDAVRTARALTEGATLLVERTVNYAFWLGVDDDLAFGTADVIGLGDGVLHICDHKFGENPNNKVFAYDTLDDGTIVPNQQLVLYALGALYEYEQMGDFQIVRMSIIQPYLDHVSTCEIDVTSLKTEGLKLKAAAHAAVRLYENVDDPPPEAFAPSGHACQWCSAKHACPALASNVEEETRDLFGALVEHGASAMAAAVPEDRLAQAMSKVGLIEDFCKAIRSEVERRLLAGHPVPGFKLVEGRAGPRSWTDEDKALKDLRRALGAKDAVVMKPISPTQVETQFVKRGLLSARVWKNLSANVERSDGKPSVAPESDKRPAIVSSSTETVFASLAASVEAIGAEDLV